MYEKCKGKIVKLNFCIKLMPQLDVNLMYMKVVELEEAYLIAEDHF